MPKFRVVLTALANMRQVIEVEADDEDEAQEKVFRDDSGYYYGDHEWKYQGVDGNSIDTSATEIR
ncbi:MAG: hypothetical protein JSS66_05885 [Armatimonadetes bacterium]|nr:hypothetical protein [Armatimonadota bacterium]